MTETLTLKKTLPIGSMGKKTVGWWGIWTLIVTEGSLFGYFLLIYFYLYLQSNQTWPPAGQPKLFLPTINTVILFLSSIFVYASDCLLRKRRLSLLLMGVAIVLGIIFVTIQLSEWHKKPYGLTTNLYSSLYFTITGFHMAHVIVGLIVLTLLMLWTAMGYFNEKRHAAITIGGLYWHFIDAVWLVIFTSLYLVPYLQGK